MKLHNWIVWTLECLTLE